jgi:formylglycine-generating enzyme required for sulfatase activity
MVRIASGRFDYWTYYQGEQAVEIEEPFAISRYEVTREEFERFVDNSRHRPATDNRGGCQDNQQGRSTWSRPRFPEFRQPDTHPVVCVGIQDAIAYAEWLSQQTGQRYRLPSAAEWQYAARAGSPEALVIDRSERKFCGRANLDENDRDNCTDGVRYTAEVGRFPANGVGLRDMIGNVAEWVSACVRVVDNRFHLAARGAYENIDACDSPYRVAMGGAWYHAGLNARFTFSSAATFERVDRNPGGAWHVGFRVVRDLR